MIFNHPCIAFSFLFRLLFFSSSSSPSCLFCGCRGDGGDVGGDGDDGDGCVCEAEARVGY